MQWLWDLHIDFDAWLYTLDNQLVLEEKEGVQDGAAVPKDVEDVPAVMEGVQDVPTKMEGLEHAAAEMEGEEVHEFDVLTAGDDNGFYHSLAD
jgi:hypothetical protein